MNKIDKMFAWFNSPITTASMIAMFSISGYVVIMGVLVALIIFDGAPINVENQQLTEARNISAKNTERIEILIIDINALINDLRERNENE